jgi:rRNA-processing protein FCF1
MLKPVSMPNLPDNDVAAVIIDGRADKKIKKAFKDRKIEVIETMAHTNVYAAIEGHPDIMLHHIEDNIFVYAPDTPETLISKLKDMGFDMRLGNTVLKNKYPYTIAYNVARVGNYAIHDTRYTDPVIKQLLLQKGVEFIHVRQGYSKCLTCIVNENSIITSDTDICKKAGKAGIDALLIEPDASIKLEPFDMGFLGGATGLIGVNKLAFTGNIERHRNFREILSFLSLKNIDMVMLNDGALIDIGTIIPIMQKSD